MRLLIVNGNPFEVQNGKYYTAFSWPLFARKLADYVAHATLWAPLRKVPDGYPVKGDLFEPGRLEITGSHYYTGFLDYYLTYLPNYRCLIRQAEDLIKSHDISLVRIPAPITSLITKYSIRFNRPFALLVASNLATSSPRLLMSRGIKRMAFKLAIDFLLNQEYKCAQNASLVYAYGEELANYFDKWCPNVKPMRTAHISLKDISPREDTCAGKTIQLLRVCWLIPNKGLEYLFEAIYLLRKEGLTVQLKIVGKEMNQRYGAHLRRMVQDIGIEKYVEFADWIPHAELRQVYRESDIQVISSIAEGVPRVILEGAANGLPLVSTSAGGCSSAIRNGEEGILVTPGNPVALAEGIKHVILNGSLRRKIIQGGLEMAKRYSSEIVCQQIAKDLNEIVEGKSRVV